MVELESADGAYHFKHRWVTILKIKMFQSQRLKLNDIQNPVKKNIYVASEIGILSFVPELSQGIVSLVPGVKWIVPGTTGQCKDRALARALSAT